MSNKTGFKEFFFFNKINNFDGNICIEENIILYVKKCNEAKIKFPSHRLILSVIPDFSY